MAALGAIVGVVGSIVSAVGAAQQGAAAQAAGEAERNAQYFQAQQQERQGARVLAKETREAEQTRIEKEVAQSRVATVAAASGAGMLNPSILDIQGDLEKEGEYRSGLQVAAGLADQRHMMDQANASRYAGDIAKMRGDAARKNSMFEALGIGLGGLGKIAGSVGGGSSGGGYKSSRYDFG